MVSQKHRSLGAVTAHHQDTQASTHAEPASERERGIHAAPHRLRTNSSAAPGTQPGKAGGGRAGRAGPGRRLGIGGRAGEPAPLSPGRPAGRKMQRRCCCCGCKGTTWPKEAAAAARRQQRGCGAGRRPDWGTWGKIMGIKSGFTLGNLVFFWMVSCVKGKDAGQKKGGGSLPFPSLPPMHTHLGGGGRIVIGGKKRGEGA